jgi:hypothetical protein
MQSNNPFFFLCYHSYSNSVVQALYYCKPLRQCVLNYPQLDGSQILFTPSSPALQQPSYFPPSTTSSSSTTTSSTIKTNGTAPKESSAFIPKNTPPRNGINIEKDQNSINTAPGMEDTLFASLKDLFWKISTNKKKTGVIAPVNFINKVKKENGKE